MTARAARTMLVWVVVLGLSALSLSACSVPHKKGNQTIQKVAAGSSETDQILRHYREVRNTAISLLDPKPLSTIETGPFLAIDSGSFKVSQELAQKQKRDKSKLDIIDVRSPLLTKYPLWFMARVKDDSRDVIKVQVFERKTAVDPWLLVASPEMLGRTKWPQLSDGPHDSIVAVLPDSAKTNSSKSVPMSPQSAANLYAKALGDPKSDAAKKVEVDGFITQMRDVARSNSALKNVTFSQSWAAEDAKFAARTDDGGELVFVTLLRADTYQVKKKGLSVSWPDGSPQKALLPENITAAGKLRYYHQILLYVPGSGDKKPRALGQFGGVASGDGA